MNDAGSGLVPDRSKLADVFGRHTNLHDGTGALKLAFRDRDHLCAEAQEAADLDVDRRYLAVGLSINTVHRADLAAIGGKDGQSNQWILCLIGWPGRWGGRR
jgi:hypothetical protein